ncbi:MAG: RIP metalloprotease RseP [Alphaproteobacteria bacterium]|nr:RIP metalloprotease RseP [Alphaproteobacteria bacterium]
MDWINLAWTNGVSFLFILTVIVFFHELGHYAVARFNGVRVEVFSIGFGPEIYGWTAKSGTRWKISLLPLGGYVKMFGETMSGAGDEDEVELSEEEKSVSFHSKKVGQRAAIVVAGPLANFLLAIVVLTVLFSTAGQPFTAAEIGKVQAGSAAATAGMRPGDKFVSIDGRAVERFEDVQGIVRMAAGEELTFTIRRDGRDIVVKATPKHHELVDRLGNKSKIGLLGVTRAGPNYVRHNPAEAVYRATLETWRISAMTLQAVGQIIVGSRSAEGLGGPIRIAQMSGQVAELGLVNLFWFLSLLSINLGLINLFPIPMLDGGHLVFYGIEAVQGRPVSDRFMEYGFRFGLGLVVTLFLFVTAQDLLRFEAIARFFQGLVS